MLNKKINEINIRDPFIIKANGGFCLYGTKRKNGFDAWFSKDLKVFTGPYDIYTNDSEIETNSFWAPEVHYYKGLYYMFATLLYKGKNRCSQIFVCDNPLGQFEPLEKPFTPENWQCLDATLYIENDVPYSVFCREWLQVRDGETYAVQLSNDLKKTVGEPKLLFKASEAKWTAPLENDGYVTDGPFIKKLKNGKLIMLWSSFSEKGYAQALAVCKSGKLFGKWEQQEKPLFDNDGGHGMIFENDKEYLVLHTPNSNMNERIEIHEIAQNVDGIQLKAIL
jgi:GH43 family beta-xylosidase